MGIRRENVKIRIHREVIVNIRIIYNRTFYYHYHVARRERLLTAADRCGYYTFSLFAKLYTLSRSPRRTLPSDRRAQNSRRFHDVVSGHGCDMDGWKLIDLLFLRLRHGHTQNGNRAMWISFHCFIVLWGAFSLLTFGVLSSGLSDVIQVWIEIVFGKSCITVRHRTSLRRKLILPKSGFSHIVWFGTNEGAYELFWQL